MTVAETKLLEYINDNVKSLKEDMTHRLDKIDGKMDNLVTKEDCKTNRENCEQLATGKGEMSIKRMSAVGGVIVGTIAASTTAAVTVLKVFYP